MRFEEILPFMREGKKAKIKNCGHYWKITKNSNFSAAPNITKFNLDGTIDQDDDPSSMSTYLIMSENWVLIDEQK